MKTRRSRVYALTIGMIVVLLFTTVQSAAGAGASHGPWQTDLFIADTALTNISTTFGGPSQVPILSATWAAEQALHFYWPYPGDSFVGPGGHWNYFYQAMPLMDMDHVSDIAEHTYIESFVLSWVYVRNDGDVYRVYMEFIDDPVWGIARLNYHNDRLYHPPDGYTVQGKPSHALDGSGNPHVAIIIGATATPFTKSLIYIKEASSTQSSCNFVSDYQCDIIETRNGITGGIGATPKITVNSSYVPGILFYDSYYDYLTYAYPQSNTNYYPNCGPGDNTWRCVQISDSAQSSSVMDSDIGAGVSQPQFAWSYEDGLNQTWVNHARFVGSGGNCGDDYYRNQFNMIVHGNRWECHQTAEIGIDPYTISVSIQVDNNNNPMIACNPGDTVAQLGVIYGDADNNFTYQKVESGPINTGKNASLALSSSGRGFIAYIEDEEYSPNLRIALQSLTTYIPIVQR